MASVICLLWIGYKLHAPFWYFALLIITMLINTYRLGKSIGEISNRRLLKGE